MISGATQPEANPDRFEWTLTEAPRHVALMITADLTRPANVQRALLRLGEAAQLTGSKSFAGKPWQWWTRDPGPAEHGVAQSAGWQPIRSVHRLRMTLDAGCASDGASSSAHQPEQQKEPSADARSADTTPSQRSTIALRDFDRHHDCDQIIRINNAAFEWHPDQRNWTSTDIERTLAQPWHRDGDLLVVPISAIGDNHDIESERPPSSSPDDVAAFCWMKIHEADNTTTGEIFLIAVDPQFSGAGVGSRLVRTALEHMVKRGATTAELWCEHDNHAALAMYERIGFRIVGTDVAFAPISSETDETDTTSENEPKGDT